MSTQPNAMVEQEANGSLPLAFPARYAIFGVFRADLERGELYQRGNRVKVQAKLFQALELLVRRAGEVVTREEVRHHLWPDTFLTNLDANVNTTMNKLRQVLGDSPENPVYIETIPRRGYSFVAAVKFSNAPETPARIRAVLNPDPEAGGTGQLWSDRGLFVFARAISLLFAGMILGALLVFVWFFSQAKSRHAETDTRIAVPAAELILQRSSGEFAKTI
jgi:DNA-binding winged helix-turn-helix (wHTH) protein